MISNGLQAVQPDAAEILRSIGEAAYDWQIDSDQLRWSGHISELLGASADQMTSGRAFAQLVVAENGLSRADVIAQSTGRDVGAGVPYELQYAFKRGDELLRVEDIGRWFGGPDGKPQRAHGIIRRIDERYDREARLSRLARLDPLTGELNRSYLTELLGKTLDETVRARGSCGFLLISIDHLGRLNDAYGIEAVEDLIAKVAKRIRERLRGKDHLGRFSGNKFGVILSQCTVDEMAVAADRLLHGVRDEPVMTVAGPLAVTVSIGGVTAPRHARTLSEIFSRAMDALHAARAKRLGSFMAYKPSVERDALRRATLQVSDEVIAALNNRRIALAYEPVASAQSRDIAFYECLMRVYRADGAIVHAGDIIPLAEKVGLVRLIDFRMLELVVAELAAAPHISASVNVSPASTVDPDWWVGLASLLRANTGVAERLIVEITETAAIQDIDDARGFVTRVRDLGCRIALDDFGAGHTSFRNLRKLGVDIVKIDGGFVQNIVRSSDDRAFVQALVELARRLGLKTVAEWVQDEAAATMLRDWGCDYLQGALIGLAASDRPWGDSRTQAAAG